MCAVVLGKIARIRSNPDPPDKRHLTRRNADRCLTPSGRGRLGPVWGPVCGSKGSEPAQIDPDRASYNLQLQPHEL